MGFTVTKKEQRKACGEKGRGSAARHTQGALGCRLRAMVAKELRWTCEVLDHSITEWLGLEESLKFI